MFTYLSLCTRPLVYVSLLQENGHELWASHWYWRRYAATLPRSTPHDSARVSPSTDLKADISAVQEELKAQDSLAAKVRVYS